MRPSPSGASSHAHLTQDGRGRRCSSASRASPHPAPPPVATAGAQAPSGYGDRARSCSRDKWCARHPEVRRPPVAASAAAATSGAAAGKGMIWIGAAPAEVCTPAVWLHTSASVHVHTRAASRRRGAWCRCTVPSKKSDLEKEFHVLIAAGALLSLKADNEAPTYQPPRILKSI